MGNLIDLTNKRFSRWTVIKRAANGGKHVRWLCKCDCGQVKTVFGDSLKSGLSTSCGCYFREVHRSLYKDMLGLHFDRLRVIEKGPLIKETYWWKCICDCGESILVDGVNLRRGDTQSCGCLRLERATEANTKHGQASRQILNKKRSGAYGSWESMIQRCENPNHKEYWRYGGKGIKIDPVVREFADFYAYMGDRPEGYTLHRPDPRGNYEKGNIKWADLRAQSHEQIKYVQPDKIMINPKRKRGRHGKGGERVYRIWGGMKQRCYNPKNPSYPYYGGRGIKFCDCCSWEDFKNFYRDMGDPLPGYEIDRIDNNGNYCKDNCQWVTRSEQVRNRRIFKIIDPE
ncbi:hypothetical protein MYX76_16345 [Desulfobacterota bacterium AH_259_B03_O07]|nr:hypothetical protein [Desulfobacterota bacterium AH_259_B03_O07]